MTQDEIDLLKKVNWFADLPEDFFAALAGKVRKRVLDKDDILFKKGDEGEAIFFINSGSVKIVTKDSQDHEVVLNRVGAGEVIGEMALLDLEPRSAGVVALEETSIMELGRDDFMEILSGQPDLALAVIRSLIGRLRHNTSYIEQITEMSRRVARGDYSFIGEFHSVHEEKEKTGTQDKIGLLMAEFIAMVRGVRKREEDLKEQVQKLTLQIDEAQRRREVEKITNTDYYARLKNQAQHLRAQRKDNK